MEELISYKAKNCVSIIYIPSASLIKFNILLIVFDLTFC
jgi:hypothetical protein